MARNMSRDYIRKLVMTKAPNGFRFDIENYLHNPHLDHEYPSFKRVVSETADTLTFESIIYFKFWNGTGEYQRKTYTMPRGEGWHVCTDMKEERIEEANRFSLKRMLAICEEVGA